ncbi:Uma2 family endonuclease [Paenibacillus flagellatus]|uniref:Uma2 family endonuclease n=1 Tax=Paenibacillus flagellatus TaxID=2211139 RepID=A0A2V5KPE7_9BACL|nr:Uma2 family endonuclease [Paenibacillus flagellatus]PYI53047.1 Uma2 family endonuclease [Paenibacillus flagellatus]
MSMPSDRSRYTYADYLKWGEGERVELIEGYAYAMTPAPSRAHQEVLLALASEFSNFLRGKRCRAYIAPFDVRLPRGTETDEETLTVVQPDLSVVCDPGKLDDRGCKGAPDLIVEVVSPGSLKLDTTVKRKRYEQAGVREYWVVYPNEKAVLTYFLEESGRFDEGESYGKEDTIAVRVLDGLSIPLERVFA